MITRGNDTVLASSALTDAAGDPVTTGTVKVALLDVRAAAYDADDVPSAYVYLAATAMAHDAAGVWKKTIAAALTVQDLIPAAVENLLVRITVEVSGLVAATFDRIEELSDLNLPQTREARILALIDARLEGRLVSGKDLESYGAAGHTAMKIPFAQLVRFQAIYQMKVDKQKRSGFSKSVAVRFANG